MDTATTAFEVTFRITRPLGATPVIADLADVLREAAGLPYDAPEWIALRAKLTAGEPVRVRLSPLQFCRFFMGRRAIGRDGYRLTWTDAEEVEVPEEATVFRREPVTKEFNADRPSDGELTGWRSRWCASCGREHGAAFVCASYSPEIAAEARAYEPGAGA